MAASNSEFKKLQKLWYAKLAKSGFKDIELPNGDMTGRIRADDTHPRGKMFIEHRDYYLAASHVEREVLQAEFGRIAVKVWNLHSEGISTTEIGRQIGKSQSYVWSLIRKIDVRFKLKRGINEKV